MVPVLREGETLSVGRLPSMSGSSASSDRPGRVLWAMWLCATCVKPDINEEPEEVRIERKLAEMALNRRALRSGTENRRLKNVRKDQDAALNRPR